jgi:APA family basic amino acid/polyamine antiporter
MRLMKHQFNHSNSLLRAMGPFSATMLVVANMIGTGIFTTPGLVMAELNNPASFLLCWLAGGVFALCGALCYGELGVRYPRAGGEYAYLRAAFGKLTGFLSGWISLVVGFSAPIAASAMAIAAYATGVGPDSGTAIGVLRVAGTPVVTLSLQSIMACAVILCFSVLHYHSLHLGARVQNSLTLLKIGIMALFIAAAMGSGRADWQAVRPGLLSGDFSAARWAVALIFVSFAYSGWNAAAYLGGEIRSPHRNLPLALICGTLVVTLLYMTLTTGLLLALGPDKMKGVVDVGTRAAKVLFGAAAGRWIGAAIAFGLLSVLSAMIMSGPRVYYAMARDGIFFLRMGRLNRLQKTPAAAIFLQAGIAMAMVLTATFDQLLIYIGFTLSLSALVTVAGLIIMRGRHAPVPGRYRTPGYPWTPLLFIVGNAWIIVYSINSRPLASLLGLATIGSGLMAYGVFARQARRSGGNAEPKDVTQNP